MRITPSHLAHTPICLLAAVACLVTPARARAQDLSGFEAGQMPALLETYKQLHAQPELSHFEINTSAMLAGELRKAGYTVTDHLGVYPDGTHAYGVAGVLKNGPGKTLLVRGDMDALPIVEETGVPYASHVMTTNAAGQKVGVMHACGHDVHTTVLLGTARTLAANKQLWHGTLIILGQPSEETGDGAKAMLRDHLYQRIGVTPDEVIGMHDLNTLAAGTIGVTSGPAMASITSVDVTIKGIGGHGAKPNQGRDPIVLAAQFIVDLQSIVSREEDPRDPAVITVGDIHGGTKRNIIPNEVKLELTVRAFSEKSRAILLDGIRRRAAAIAVAAGLPPELAPVVTQVEEFGEVTNNDPAQTARIRATLVKTLGEQNVIDHPPLMVSEDVGNFATAAKVPLTYFWLGAMYPDRFAAATARGIELPGMHTSHFEPDPEPTLATGVKALSAVSVSLLQ